MAIVVTGLICVASACDRHPPSSDTAAAKAPTPFAFTIRSHELIEQSAPLATPLATLNTASATQQPTPPQVSVTAVAEPREGSAPLTVIFHAKVERIPPGVHFEWNFGDASAPAYQLRVRHTYQSAGTYTATFLVSGEDVEESSSITIAVSEPTFDLAIDADPDIGMAPLTVRLSAVFNDNLPGPFSYQWDFGDGGQDIRNPAVHTFESPGEFVVSLLVTDARGHSGQADIHIQVDPRPGADQAY